MKAKPARQAPSTIQREVRQLHPTAPKKFKLRHALRRLFRRDKSKTVKVKAADPRQVKLLLDSWGVAILVILAALAVFRYFSPDAAEILRKAEAAVDRADYTEAINQYDKLLKTYPKTSDADGIRALRVLAELRRAVQQAVALGDWPAALEVAQREVPKLPKPASAELLQKVGMALAHIADGLAKQGRPGPTSCRLNACARSRTSSTTTSRRMPGPGKCSRESAAR